MSFVSGKVVQAEGQFKLGYSEKNMSTMGRPKMWTLTSTLWCQMFGVFSAELTFGVFKSSEVDRALISALGR